jgi:hypothetical protein
MPSALVHRARIAILFAAAAVLMAVYLLPTYPKTISGWLWLLGGSLPYAILLGICGSALNRYWPQGGLRALAAAFLAVPVIFLATAAYLWLCGVV